VPIDPWGAPPATDPWGAPPAEGDIAPAPEDEKVDDDRKPREREFDEEDNTISYDEYLAQLKDTTTSSIPKLEGVRGANEGAEEDVWGNVIEHKRNEDEEAYYVGKSKGSNKVRAEKKEKVFIEIDARFERPSRGGRGRGGDRGRGRGGRGGKGRGNVNGAPTSEVDVADETAFPSLS
jgi:plasminogen activator inhibitor 1 RNA-binding protein